MKKLIVEVVSWICDLSWFTLSFSFFLWFYAEEYMKSYQSTYCSRIGGCLPDWCFYYSTMYFLCFWGSVYALVLEDLSCFGKQTQRLEILREKCYHAFQKQCLYCLVCHGRFEFSWWERAKFPVTGESGVVACIWEVTTKQLRQSKLVPCSTVLRIKALKNTAKRQRTVIGNYESCYSILPSETSLELKID